MVKPSFQRERVLWMSFTIILLLVCLVQINRLKKETADATRQVRTAVQEQQRLKESISNLNASIGDLKELRELDLERYRKNLGLLDEMEVSYLKAKGLNNPIKDLTAGLQKHPELIPHKGILGGRMGFYSPRSIHILSTKWVLAGFEDGHIWGNALLKYQVSNSKISWQVIDSYIQQ